MQNAWLTLNASMWCTNIVIKLHPFCFDEPIVFTWWHVSIADFVLSLLVYVSRLRIFYQHCAIYIDFSHQIAGTHDTTNTHTRLRFRRLWYLPVWNGFTFRLGIWGISTNLYRLWAALECLRLAVPATSPNRAAASAINWGGCGSGQLNTSSAKSMKSNSDVSKPESTLNPSVDLPNRGTAGFARWRPPPAVVGLFCGNREHLLDTLDLYCI